MTALQRRNASLRAIGWNRQGGSRAGGTAREWWGRFSPCPVASQSLRTGLGLAKELGAVVWRSGDTRFEDGEEKAKQLCTDTNSKALD